ncbi:Ribosomal RNA large subunit methyltransferase I [Enhygromyxa salina]|uniref:Ribosomal RNA large subunit methyltransferase I n=1 Tax=Enhygromyxa salina TaxID=215803 RepID=A0A2S9YEJ4_9BACT|nr:methyltransferase domain-containing protein [Enhygromyxa salina]PRQ03523.1 Ribosomal RNA large subunit methyltransferase I [Enhygromyxa salina]
MTVRIELRRDAGKVDPSRDLWIRRRQVARVLGPPDPTAIAELVDHRAKVLGFGLYSPDSGIVLRLLCGGQQPPPPDWLERGLAAALAGRAALGLGAETTGFREVNSEGDGLPGLVVDRFGDWRVVQITTAPIAARRPEICAWLAEHAPLAGGQIVVMGEAAAELEGFAPGLEVHARDGTDRGPAQLEWLEHGRPFVAPAPPAQKTGAYHDQRDNRSRFAALVAARGAREAPPRVLDLGCHVGGFSIAAARRGATVVAVDQSARALEFAARNAAANAVSAQVETVAADMFGDLAAPALAGPFDAVIFDPPKVARSRRDLGRALEALTRTLSRLLPRVADDGLVALCSCSHHLGWDELDRAVLDACGRAVRTAGPGRVVRLDRWGAGPDHPISPGHREGEYLRVAVYQRRQT